MVAAKPGSSSELCAGLRARFPLCLSRDLRRMRCLLAKLGNPHHKLPPVIHVAGTNGKGSVISTCRAIMEEAGYTVHTFTSPHLVRLNERVRIGQRGGGKLVDEDDYACAIREVELAAKGEEVTFFEVITAAAFVIFAETPADFSLIEVGLGGRFDATNVVSPPLASVITNISIDHECHLGTSLQGIASEKLGILKRGTPFVVSSPQAEEVVSIIQAAADSINAKLGLGLRDWKVRRNMETLVFQDETCSMTLPLPSLIGPHQYENAGTAIATLRSAGLVTDVSTISSGLGKVHWLGRMHKLSDGPIMSLVPSGSEVWLDGCHNPGAGMAISRVLDEIYAECQRPFYLVLGMLDTKDHAAFLRGLLGDEDNRKRLRKAIMVPVTGNQMGQWRRGDMTQSVLQNVSDATEILAGKAEMMEIPSESGQDFTQALARISEIATASQDLTPPRILICGSLYLMGAVLEYNGTHMT